MHAVLAPTATETTIRLEGPVDAPEADLLRDLLHALASTAPGPVVIDLSSVSLIDSIGVGVLVGAEKRFRANGRTLRLRDPRPPIRHVLDATGVSSKLEVEETHPDDDVHWDQHRREQGAW